MDILSDDSDQEDENDDASDPDYEPSSDDKTNDEIEDRDDPVDLPSNTHCHEERKYIVFQSSLLELFRVCRCCHGPGQTSLTEVGTYLKVIFACLECDFRLEWTSQPLVGKMPVGNLLLSAGILFTGNLLTKVFRFLDAMNIAHQSKKTYYNHQVNYLQPIIVNKWLQDQQSLLNEASLLTGGLILAGGGRSDSPGFSAKYGGFNCIECRLNKVIDIQLVQSNEVGNSARCENEGLKRTYRFLQEAGHKVDVFITDRHKANEKTIKDEFKVTHYFDVWHDAKSITKKLTKLTNKNKMEIVALWRKSIINHLHWVAASTPNGDGQTMLAKWLSLLNHIVNRHEMHGDLMLTLNHHLKQQVNEQLFPTCLHGPLQEDRNKLWFTPDSEEYDAVCKIVEDRYLLKDVQKLSPLYQTSTLEAFHSLVVRFCPKHTAFSWMGMYCRLFLAAMHFNENANRAEKCDAAGNPKVSVQFPKAKKGEFSIKILKQEPTYDYRKILTTELFSKYAKDPSGLPQSLPERFKNRPKSLAATYHHPTQEEAKATYSRRFSK